MRLRELATEVQQLREEVARLRTQVDALTPKPAKAAPAKKV
ncbi:hypothetical protein [Asanoa siamensis]|uniref:Uncharacterized protein n=1 Tax=Asanoa siamensis TaxID=926357 RepID=A0ABQ4CKV0_9ACTN|nr:hypothetical protein [Asanoa siamensis]GIF71904.1 hypothetical protein Asi02nite_14220 [Asanoa siamensis]